MARNSVVRPYLLRHLLRDRPFSPSNVRSSSVYETLFSSFPALSPTVPAKSFSSFHSTITSPKFQYSHQNFGNFRTLCSSSPGPSNVVSLKSEEEFNNSLSKVQDESLPAIFYFTAAWCGPCRFIAPKIIEWSKEYPHVTIYKIDIDEKGMESALRKLDITAVPTFLFFQNGKQVSQVVGATSESLIATMKQLYKQD